MSASISNGDYSIATSKRRHIVHNAKEEQRLNNWNSGLPKGRNPQGNGSAIVGTGYRPYSTEVRKSKDSPKLKAHVGRKSLGEMIILNEEGKCTNAYDLVINIQVLETAYMNIKSEPGNMTPGADNETLDGISKD